MPRPVELIFPTQPDIIISGLGGLANTNLIPIGPFGTNYTPTLIGVPPGSPASLVPSSFPVLIGRTIKNVLGCNREFIVKSTMNVNLPTATFSLQGRDLNNNNVQESIVGISPFGAFQVNNKYAYLDSFVCDQDTPNGIFNLLYGDALATIPVSLDYIYPNTSFSVAGLMLQGASGSFAIYGTIQKPTLFNQNGIPYPNPSIQWDLLLNGSTDAIFSSHEMRTAVYMNASASNGAVGLVVLQQGVR